MKMEPKFSHQEPFGLSFQGKHWLLVSNSISFFVISSSYLVGVIKESFWSDDYLFLSNLSSSFKDNVADFRPTLATLFRLGFGILNGPTDAWILRALGFLGLVLLFATVSKGLSRRTNSALPVFAAAVGFCLPCFQMGVHWAAGWLYTWSALLGIVAFDLWVQATKRKIFAVLIMTLALTTYPPFAFFFFAKIAVDNVIGNETTKTLLKQIRQGVTLSALSAFASLILAAGFLRFFHVERAARVSVVGIMEFPQKMYWLISRPLLSSFRPFQIDSPSPTRAIITAVPIVIVLVIGILHQAKLLNERFFFRFIAALFSLSLAIAPLIVTSANQIEFRLISGLSWGITTLVIYFILQGLGSLGRNPGVPSGLSHLLVFASISSLSLLAVVTTNTHYRELFLIPYQGKTYFINKNIQACPSETKSILVLPPTEIFPTRKRLGVFSTITDFSHGGPIIPNVKLLARTRFANVEVLLAKNRKIDAIDLNTQNICILDLEKFRLQLLKRG